MHLDVSLQLAQLAASILTGFGLGLTYDALRALRRELCRNAALDTLFCAVLLLTLFTLGMDIGQGEFTYSCSAQRRRALRHIWRS